MASAQPPGSSLSEDIAKIRSNELLIDDLTKTVKLLEQEKPTQGNINLIHNYKLYILQLETEIKDLRDKLDRL